MKTIKTFHREFTNYSGFENYEGILFMDSLANMVQEFLYNNPDEKEPRGYRLDGIIKLYDFMSLELFFVKSMLHELGKTAIKGYIDDLRQSRYSYEHKLVIEYENKGQDLLVCNASDMLIIPLLWTAYIYANTRYLYEKDEGFKNATSMLYELMMEYSYYDKEYTKELSPIKYSKEAMKMLANHIRKKYNELVKEQTESANAEKENVEVSSDALEQLKAKLAASNDRVSVLERENEELKAFKREIEELTEITPEERLGIDERAIYFSTSMGLDFDPKRTNQKQLSIMISKLSGDAPDSIRGRISKMHKMEEDNQFSDEILLAARNVIGYLEKVPRGNQTQKVKEMIDNIDLVFLNAKNS